MRNSHINTLKDILDELNKATKIFSNTEDLFSCKLSLENIKLLFFSLIERHDAEGLINYLTQLNTDELETLYDILCTKSTFIANRSAILDLIFYYCNNKYKFGPTKEWLIPNSNILIIWNNYGYFDSEFGRLWVKQQFNTYKNLYYHIGKILPTHFEKESFICNLNENFHNFKFRTLKKSHFYNILEGLIYNGNKINLALTYLYNFTPYAEDNLLLLGEEETFHNFVTNLKPFYPKIEENLFNYIEKYKTYSYLMDEIDYFSKHFDKTKIYLAEYGIL